MTFASIVPVLVVVVWVVVVLELGAADGAVTPTESLNGITRRIELVADAADGPMFSTKILVSSTNTHVDVRAAMEAPRPLSEVVTFGMIAAWDEPLVVSVNSSKTAGGDEARWFTISSPTGDERDLMTDVREISGSASTPQNTSLGMRISDGLPSSGNRWLYLVIFAEYEAARLASARDTVMTFVPVISDKTGTIAASVGAVAFVLMSALLWHWQKKYRWCSRMCSPRQVKDRRGQRAAAVEQQEDAYSSEYAYEYESDDGYADVSTGGDEETSVLATSSAYEYAYESSSSQLTLVEVSDGDAEAGGGADAGSSKSKRKKSGIKKMAVRGATNPSTQQRGCGRPDRRQELPVSRKRRKRHVPTKEERAAVAAAKRAELRKNTGVVAYVFLALFRVLFLVFDAIKLLINLQLIRSSVALYVADLPELQVYEDFLPFGSFTGALFSVNSLLNFFNSFTEEVLVWNCGGTLLLSFPWILAAFMALFGVVLQRDLLLWVSIRILGYRPCTGRIGTMMFHGVSALLQAILFYMLQVVILMLPQVLVGMWSISRTCSAVDKQMADIMFYANIGIMVICFFIILVTFSGRPENVGKWGIFTPVVVVIGAVKRLLMLSFGIWTPSLISSYSVLERALEFDDDPDDDDQKHENVLVVLGKSRSLIWMMLPVTIVLAKLAETINNPPLVVRHPSVEMTTGTAFRAVILCFHLVTFGLLVAVVLLGGLVLFQIMLGSLIPLHIFLLGLDYYGVTAD
ncbi:uncharacterized protein AMSG_08923 [Thecamonas trahens ATCC 50062]|uniref:Transmembrane protein n=1 Tax=Thecamonas trahens ATCC 50062 TaxID=461836 RepID=A0A0L0DM79_THETB|nr:hypothetical protein AMSG_08923 [Thecamonas trahens ATCC 50062]KNC53417.1 hypothetical protein AMSG_08923 [Thecamonas trahens ATCC 50062]|eukprot:XP_013754456.1 hypothetical protein AMSG_08923 [Thecamonas trahens ATCC 50062]